MRVAMISMHTSPLEQPGIGDAGGMNVYVRNVAEHLVAHGIEVDVFTRATRASQGEAGRDQGSCEHVDRTMGSAGPHHVAPWSVSAV